MIDGIGGRLAPIAARPAATTAPVAPTAKVNPAPSGMSMLAAVRDMAAAPPVDSTKVASIKNAIATGTYAVSPAAIADRMIAIDLRG